MSALSYEYRKPQTTNTIEDWISCKSKTDMTYYNSSYIDQDKTKNIYYSAYNVLSDYIDDIRTDYCITVTLTKDEMIRYKYRPKLLAFDLYGDTELAFIILLINDMYTAKQFVKEKILLPKKKDMQDICNRVLNANRESINLYSYNYN